MTKKERAALEQELRDLRAASAKRDQQLRMQNAFSVFLACGFARVSNGAITTERLEACGLEDADRADIVAITAPFHRLMAKLDAGTAASLTLSRIARKQKPKA